ncbi:MAG: hypothetical protein AAB336_12155 [Acidobacteriota bacterium]
MTQSFYSNDLIRTLSTERAKANNLRIASFGEVKKLVFVGDEMLEGKKIYRYKVEIAKRIFLWRFVFNNEGKISEMTLEEEE